MDIDLQQRVLRKVHSRNRNDRSNFFPFEWKMAKKALLFDVMFQFLNLLVRSSNALSFTRRVFCEGVILVKVVDCFGVHD